MFITIEGVDGSGKTTLIAGLANFLKEKHIDFITTREPGGTPTAENLRNLALGTELNALAELYVFAAARVEHCQDVIIPALQKGIWVLCDRFSASTYVYQQCERYVSPEIVGTVNNSIIDMFRTSGLMTTPSITHLELILDCSYDVACTRLAARKSQLMNLKDTIDKTIFENRRNYYSKYVSISPTAVHINADSDERNTLELAKRVIQNSIIEFENVLKDEAAFYTEHVSSDPVSPITGQLWYNTTDGVYRGWDGKTVLTFDTKLHVSLLACNKYIG